MRHLSSILIAALMLAFVSEAEAQQVVKQRIGTYRESGNVVVSEATTTLAVDLTVECTEVETGPYARYAQKLLGKRASLISRISYEIVAADVAVLATADYHASAVDTSAAVQCVTTLGDDISIDRLSANEFSVEAAAEAAARKIYDLRAVREELIMGEYGDGVYGAGLEAALREIDKLEREYLELFYGTRTVTTTKHRIVVPVVESAPNMVVARFNVDEGLLPKDNIAGDIILVAITPSNMSYPASDEKGSVAYRYANNAMVVVSCGHKALTTRILPIYEFGKTVYYTSPR